MAETEARPKRAGGVCKRWRACRYGLNPVYGNGACNYSSITGHCKIAIRPDGTRTVAPVENCPYYHPKEAKK